MSVIGRMAKPLSSPRVTKLIAEKLVPHEAIAKRSCEIYEWGRGGSAEDNWFRAERELLGF